MSNASNVKWRTADGRTIAVKDMEVGHLVNVINWIMANPLSYPPTLLESTFIPEANYRRMVLFAEGKPYPGLIDGRWYVIDPTTGAGKIEAPPADYIEAVKDNEAYQRMSAKTQEFRKKQR